MESSLPYTYEINRKYSEAQASYILAASEVYKMEAAAGDNLEALDTNEYWDAYDSAIEAYSAMVDWAFKVAKSADSQTFTASAELLNELYEKRMRDDVMEMLVPLCLKLAA